MSAPPGVVLGHLIVSLLVIHFFGYKLLHQRKKNAVLAVASAAITLVVPIWEDTSLVTTTLSLIVMLGWAAAYEFTTLKEYTTLAALTLIVGPSIVWVGAYAVHGHPGWISTTLATVAALLLLTLHVLLYSEPSNNRQQYARSEAYGADY